MYVLAVGALKVYVHHPFLALFAPTPYVFPPTRTANGQIDLSSHLTNTCLQTPDREDGHSQGEKGESEEARSIVVATWQSLSAFVILDGPFKGETVGEERMRKVEDAVAETVRETFKAGVSSGSGFQVLPNCFEIFGLDFLVDDAFAVSLLEINAVRLPSLPFLSARLPFDVDSHRQPCRFLS